jgi:uncharacterized membrane protein
VLATFAGTFAFAFSLLRRVETDFVPDIGVTTAGVAVATSLALLLIYLDRFTYRLRPVAVAALVGQAGRDVLARAAEQARARIVVDHPAASAVPRKEPVLVVRAGWAGAVQAVNVPALVAVAEGHDCTIVLVRTVGDFVAPGTPLLEVHGVAPPPDGHLQGRFALGQERTIEQDPSFALRILVDIAITALSPAINDPGCARCSRACSTRSRPTIVPRCSMSCAGSTPASRPPSPISRDARSRAAATGRASAAASRMQR